MSGIFLAAAAGNIPNLIAAFGGTLSALDPSSPYAPNATLTLNTDGSNTKTGTPSVGSDTIGANWALFPLAGVGTGKWVRATLSSGTAPSSGTLNAWTQLTAAQSWATTRASAGITTTNLLLEFALDSGGALITGSASVSLIANAA